MHTFRGGGGRPPPQNCAKLASHTFEVVGSPLHGFCAKLVSHTFEEGGRGGPLKWYLGQSLTSGLHTAPGQKETRLAELKIYCGKDLYNREGRRQRRFVQAVDRRAAKLMGEYQEKAEKVDRLLGEEEGRGRVRRRLDQFGPLIGIVTGVVRHHDAAGLNGHQQGGQAGQGHSPLQPKTGSGEGEGAGGAESPALNLQSAGQHGLHAGPL